METTIDTIIDSYDKKSANAVMWKDKEYEYISSAWNKQQ